MMSEVLSIAEIESRYPNEWILVNDPVTNEALEVQSGKVHWHSADRDEVYRKALELRPKRSGFFARVEFPKEQRSFYELRL